MPKVQINDLNFDELDETPTFEKFAEIKRTKMRDDENRYKNKKTNKRRIKEDFPEYNTDE